jgi:ADP-heptose:LPS heptosyltransferase
VRTNALEHLRHTFGVQLAKWRFRKAQDDVVSFTSAISSAQRVLLIMPLTTEDLLPTLQVLEMVKSQFARENITVITGDRGVEAVRLLPHSHFIHLLKAQVSPFYLPRADFVSNLTQRRYDLAIDLNLDLVLPSGYICKVSGARIRVGFCHNYADVFYNFQVKPDPTLGRRLIYDRFVHCLRKF